MGKFLPIEILELLVGSDTERLLIWKPHTYLAYHIIWFVTRRGLGLTRTNACIAGEAEEVDMDIFCGGLCLPRDSKLSLA